MEFLTKFDAAWRGFHQQHRTLGQDQSEWRAFLEYCEGYFRHRGIRPLVVEIGVLHNAQRRFFIDLLGGEHIGIDNGSQSRERPDILGDSHDPATVKVLEDKLNGRKIDLLFIDGDHRYEAVKKDWELYSPLTSHLIALHDLLCDNEESVQVSRFWDELKTQDTQSTFIVFHRRRSHERTGIWDGHEMGIGLVVKKP